MKRILLIDFGVLFLIWLLIYLVMTNRGVTLATNNDDSKWNADEVFHILPTVCHNRMLLKVSFNRSYAEPPCLLINNKNFVSGNMQRSPG